MSFPSRDFTVSTTGMRVTNIQFYRPDIDFDATKEMRVNAQ